MDRDLFEDLTQLEQALGLPDGFYERLSAEDDWSFVIKLNALLEAAATHTLVVRLQAPELADSIANLNFAQSKCGKIALLRNLGALTQDQAKTLRMIAELRNSLIHNITNTSFRFSSYLQSCDRNQVEQFVVAFGRGVVDPVPIGDKKVPRRDFVLANPKSALWMTCAEILACMYLEKEMADLRIQRLVNAELSKILTGLTPSISDDDKS